MGACCSGKDSKGDYRNEEVYLKNCRNALIKDSNMSSEPKIEVDIEKNTLSENITKLILNFSSEQETNIKTCNGITIQKIFLEQMWNVAKFYLDDYTTSEYVLYDLREKKNKTENFLKKMKSVSYTYDQMKIMGEDRLYKFRRFLDKKSLIIIIPDENVSLLQDLISFLMVKKFNVKIHIMDSNMAVEGMNMYNQVLYRLLDTQIFRKLPYILLSLKFFPHLKSENMIFFDMIEESKVKSQFFTADVLSEAQKNMENEGTNQPFLHFISLFQISAIFRLGPNLGNASLEDKILEFKVKKLENNSGKNAKANAHVNVNNQIDVQGSMTCKLFSLNNFFSYGAFIEKKEIVESYIDVLKYEILSNNSIFIQIDSALDEDVLIQFLFLLIWKITDVDPEKIRNYIGEKYNFIPNFYKYCCTNFEKIEDLLRLYGYQNGILNLNLSLNNNYLNVNADMTNNEDLKNFKERLEYHLKKLKLDILDQLAFEQILSMIEQIVLNIINNPKNERFYSIKKRSKTFEKYIGVSQHSTAIFELFGFRTSFNAEGEEYYSLCTATNLSYFKSLFFDYVNSIKRFTGKN